MISLIVAFDRHQLIGSKNRLPWHYKEDLAYFKQTTMGHDILMGRQTFESILSYQNKPLPNRHHYVLTTTTNYDYEEVTVLANWKTPRSGAERLASLDTLTTELHFDFLVYRRAHA